MTDQNEKKGSFFRGFKEAATAPPREEKLRSAYDRGDVVEAELRGLHQRIKGLNIAAERKQALIPWAEEFYVSCRRGEPSPLNVGQLISLHALDPSAQAREKYFGELVKFDPSTAEGKLVVDHLSSHKGGALTLILMELSLSDKSKDMYDAVKADSNIKPSSPPPRRNF